MVFSRTVKGIHFNISRFNPVITEKNFARGEVSPRPTSTGCPAACQPRMIGCAWLSVAASHLKRADAQLLRRRTAYFP